MWSSCTIYAIVRYNSGDCPVWCMRLSCTIQVIVLYNSCDCLGQYMWLSCTILVIVLCNAWDCSLQYIWLYCTMNCLAATAWDCPVQWTVLQLQHEIVLYNEHSWQVLMLGIDNISAREISCGWDKNNGCVSWISFNSRGTYFLERRAHKLRIYSLEGFLPASLLWKLVLNCSF